MLNYTEVDSHGLLVWTPCTKVQRLQGGRNNRRRRRVARAIDGESGVFGVVVPDLPRNAAETGQQSLADSALAPWYRIIPKG